MDASAQCSVCNQALSSPAGTTYTYKTEEQGCAGVFARKLSISKNVVVTLTPCGHGFHAACLQQSLEEKIECPQNRCVIRHIKSTDNTDATIIPPQTFYKQLEAAAESGELETVKRIMSFPVNINREKLHTAAELAAQNLRLDVARELIINGGAHSNKACFLQGEFYSQNDKSNTNANFATAARYYELAAEQGFAPAQNRLGELCEQGLGIEKDLTKAFQCYEKSAQQENAAGQFNLGSIYLKGIGVEQNISLGLELLKKSADRGCSESLNYLGSINEDGIHQRGFWIVPPDNKKAFDYFRRAAKRGHAAGQFNLGRHYLNGLGTKKNPQKALKYLNRSAAKDFPDALNWLGATHESGLCGVKQSSEEAFRLYQKSANMDNAIGQLYLARLHRDGKGVTKNISKAIELFGKSARQECEDARKSLMELRKTAGS